MIQTPYSQQGENAISIFLILHFIMLILSTSVEIIYGLWRKIKMKSLIKGLRSHCCKLCWKKATSLVCENRTNHLAPTLCILHRPTDQHFYRKNVFPSFVDSNLVFLNNYIIYERRSTCSSWSYGRFLAFRRRVEWRSLKSMLSIWIRLRSVMGKQEDTILAAMK